VYLEWYAYSVIRIIGVMFYLMRVSEKFTARQIKLLTENLILTLKSWRAAKIVIEGF